MPDMQNLENTEIENTIVSAMPTHEPYVRPQSKKPTTSKFAISTASKEGSAIYKKNME